MASTDTLVLPRGRHAMTVPLAGRITLRAQFGISVQARFL